MKKFSPSIALIFLICASGTAFSQTKTCCSASATSTFAMLGEDPGFRSAHLAPEPVNFVATKGTEITFPVTGGPEGKAFFIKSKAQSDQYIYIFHEWWGLNDHIRMEAERYAGDFPDVNILAIDLYDGQLATNADDAGKMMQAIKQERAEAIIKGAAAYTGPKAAIQTLGWCFGGAWSLQAAILLGKQAKGCVMYYGMPEKDPAKLARLSAPVLGIFASRDGWITKPVVESFEKQMKELKKPVSITLFVADHAFANPSNPKFDEAASAKARTIVVGFLKENFAE